MCAIPASYGPIFIVVPDESRIKKKSCIRYASEIQYIILKFVTNERKKRQRKKGNCKRAA